MAEDRTTPNPDLVMVNIRKQMEAVQRLAEQFPAQQGRIPTVTNPNGAIETFDIFLSHRSTDAKKCADVKESFERLGYSVY